MAVLNIQFSLSSIKILWTEIKIVLVSFFSYSSFNRIHWHLPSNNFLFVFVCCFLFVFIFLLLGKFYFFIVHGAFCSKNFHKSWVEKTTDFFKNDFIIESDFFCVRTSINLPPNPNSSSNQRLLQLVGYQILWIYLNSLCCLFQRLSASDTRRSGA